MCRRNMPQIAIAPGPVRVAHRRSVVPSRSLPRSHGGLATRARLQTLLGASLLFSLIGGLSPRVATAQAPAPPRAAVAAAPAPQPGSAGPAATYDSADPEARPLAAYQPPRREPPPPAETSPNVL